MNREKRWQASEQNSQPLEVLSPPEQASLAHDSAAQHVQGQAAYIDDMPKREAELHLAFVGAPCAHGSLTLLNTEEARKADGVVCVLTADDIPGHKKWGPIFEDEPFLVSNEISYLEQPVCVIAAETKAQAHKACKLVKIEVEQHPPPCLA